MCSAPSLTDPPPSRASLTWFECNLLAAAARCLPGRWEAQWDRDDRGCVSVALLQDVHGVIDATAALMIWREGGWLCLGLGQGDAHVGLGTHADVDSVMGTVRRRIGAAQP